VKKARLHRARSVAHANGYAKEQPAYRAPIRNTGHPNRHRRVHPASQSRWRGKSLSTIVRGTQQGELASRLNGSISTSIHEEINECPEDLKPARHRARATAS